LEGFPPIVYKFLLFPGDHQNRLIILIKTQIQNKMFFHNFNSNLSFVGFVYA